jgi:hypothetical protein
MDKDTKEMIWLMVIVFCFCLIGALFWYAGYIDEKRQYHQQTERTNYCKALELKSDALWNCIKNN